MRGPGLSGSGRVRGGPGLRTGGGLWRGGGAAGMEVEGAGLSYRGGVCSKPTLLFESSRRSWGGAKPGAGPSWGGVKAGRGLCRENKAD